MPLCRPALGRTELAVHPPGAMHRII